MEEAKKTLLERVKELKDSLKIAESKNKAHEAKIEELQMKLAEIRSSNAKLKSDYERLKMARAYAWDEKSKRNATLRINNIVHEIDSCLALLRQDMNV
ncbi:MAG: hypothetical protein MJ002_00430 [Paludibacteraceae bacterium]|nr:hypothetical protein [Paludibacteraceae bacterium]